ncbi:unnamed protein product, partial [Mesorhabditis belari]|uniref:Uncharacterized protein n=1 Tax=Mesorhabditis belari TaxID=2138241 RepID=A0AAF3EMG3_9BILA
MSPCTTRTLPGQTTLGYRNQITQITSFLDASQIYGSTKRSLIDCARFLEGNSTRSKLMEKEISTPPNPDDPDCRHRAGNSLALEQVMISNSQVPTLASLHTIFFARAQQNRRRVVTKKCSLGKLVASSALSLQSIIFLGVLPKIISHKQMRKYALNAEKADISKVAWTRWCWVWWVRRRCKWTDMSATGFAIISSSGEGIQLPVWTCQRINIQRGRDHGVNPYNDHRELCGLKRVTEFAELSNEIFSPGFCQSVEFREHSIGPTASCPYRRAIRPSGSDAIDTISRNDLPYTRFSLAQLSSIRSISLSSIICLNSKVQRLQPDLFAISDEISNHPLTCSSYRPINLDPWIENQDCEMGKRFQPSPCTSCICTKEGRQCQSLSVTNCGQLLRDFGSRIAFEDIACRVQCGLKNRD